MTDQYGLDPSQLRTYVVEPALEHLGLAGLAATQLVLGTALTESQARYLHQVGNGPALGLWQMEPATHDDLWKNYIRFRPDLELAVAHYHNGGMDTEQNLQSNLLYAASMCRVQYLRAPAALPAAGDAAGMAAYWKQFYNTPKGAGTVDRALPHFVHACQG